MMLSLLFANFVQKWNLPYGNVAPGGMMLVYDTDHDEQVELIFRRWIPGSVGVYFAEFVPPDSWNIIESQTVDSVLIWDVGDFDNDGLSDLVTHGDASGGAPIPIIAVYESSDSFSYPAQEVWRDTVGSALVTPVSAYDIDQDSLPEIVKVLGDYIHLHIYETIGNNLYDKIAEITTASTYNSSSTLACGDFDSDNQNEFVWGYSAGEYSIWECTGNNSYQEIILQQLPTANIKDCFSVPDADGDGKLEFVVKGYVIPGAGIHVFIFEATGDNTYDIIKTFTLPGGDYYGGYSDVGDVDGDSIPEIALEGRQNVHIIKAAGNDSFYVWETLPGNNNGSSVRVYDIDGNGLSEVIISGDDQTRIYEYEVGIAEDNELTSLMGACDAHPNPFTNAMSIRFGAELMGDIAVNVYDVSGRLTKSLFNGSIDGYETLIWQGDDNNGIQVPPGIYFVRIDHPALRRVFCSKIIKMR
jgi:hypothetical protein